MSRRSFQKQESFKILRFSFRNNENQENDLQLNSSSRSDIDYTPSSVLQQQVSTLERLMIHESWLDLNQPETPQIPVDDDNESVGSLKEELDGVSTLLPDMQRELAQLELELGLSSRREETLQRNQDDAEDLQGATDRDEENDVSSRGDLQEDLVPSPPVKHRILRPVKHRILRKRRCSKSESLDSLRSSDTVPKSVLRLRRKNGELEDQMLLPDTQREVAQLELELGLSSPREETLQRIQDDAEDLQEATDRDEEDDVSFRRDLQEDLVVSPPVKHRILRPAKHRILRRPRTSRSESLDSLCSSDATPKSVLRLHRTNGELEDQIPERQRKPTTDAEVTCGSDIHDIPNRSPNRRAMKFSKIFRGKKAKPIETVPSAEEAESTSSGAESEQITGEETSGMSKYATKRHQGVAFTIGFDGQLVPLDDLDDQDALSDSASSTEDSVDKDPPNIIDEQDAVPKLPQDGKWKKPTCMLFASSFIMVASLIFGEPKSNALNLVSFRYC
jgi:hypothetical protein